MRTTITLDPDVAALVKKLERREGKSFKEIVNAALREGLVRLESSARKPRTRHCTEPLDLGPCLVGSIDDVSEVLALGEGDAYR
jgi:hypothetical protein